MCSPAEVIIVPLISTTNVMKHARTVTRHFFGKAQLKGFSGSLGPSQSTNSSLSLGAPSSALLGASSASGIWGPGFDDDEVTGNWNRALDIDGNDCVRLQYRDAGSVPPQSVLHTSKSTRVLAESCLQADVKAWSQSAALFFGSQDGVPPCTFGNLKRNCIPLGTKPPACNRLGWSCRVSQAIMLPIRLLNWQRRLFRVEHKKRNKQI